MSLPGEAIIQEWRRWAIALGSAADRTLMRTYRKRMGSVQTMSILFTAERNPVNRIQYKEVCILKEMT